MGNLFTLVLATPIWGFALTPPIAALPSTAIASVHATTVDADGPPIEGAADAADQASAEALADDPEHIARRETALDWTRGLQVATTVALAATVTLSAIQVADVYGFHGSRQETACALGTAAMPDVCGEPYPLPRTIVGGVASVLGLATMAARYMVPGPPSSADERNGRADRWRTYETTRLIGVALTMLQAGIGFVVSNAPRFGWLDEQDDFDALQGLAVTQLAVGSAALGVSVFNSTLLF